MKTFFKPILSFFSYNNSPIISKRLKYSIENEDLDCFSNELNNLNYSIDVCFEIKTKYYSLITIAIRLKKQKLLNFLIEQGCDVNFVCMDKSPLMYAVLQGNFEFVKILVEAGANIDFENEMGKSAIYYAKKYEYMKILNYLSNFNK